jgi:hypothetical protein
VTRLQDAIRSILFLISISNIRNMPVPEEFPAQKQDEGSEAPPALGKRAQAARASALMAGAQVMRKIT